MPRRSLAYKTLKDWTRKDAASVGSSLPFEKHPLFSCLTSAEWETNREKKLHVKGGGVPEHIHRLRNRHGPMVVSMVGFPVAQMVEHGASNAKIMDSIPRESKS